MCAQRFIQKQNLGPVDQCPGDGNTLLLAAGQRIDIAVFVAFQADNFQHFLNPLVDLVLGHLVDTQAEGNIIVNIQVGKQCIALEHGVDLTFIGRHIVDTLAVEGHVAGCGRKEAADDPQGIPDFQTKIKIIKAKAARLNAEIPEDVIIYLAENISANIREIEGAISSLVANTSFMGKRITISLAKDILKGYISLYQKEITIEHIIEVVCREMNIDRERLDSSERTREVAIARQLAMYLAKQHTKMPLTAIGAAIGGRNHATVLHSCKTISNLMDTDKSFRQQVEAIEKIVAE